MGSHGSPFEQAISTGNLNTLAPDVQEGFNLFVQTYNCMSCHDVVSNIGYVEAFGEEFVNIGLDLSPSDYGRADVTENPEDIAKFKIPNLRNIALTAPYMHDGRFETLEEVIDHYSHRVKPHDNLDQRLKDFSGEPLVHNIPDEDKQKLIAFMNALTDENFVTNPAFSDPFSE
jgi:cytochrome c peroxidase